MDLLSKIFKQFNIFGKNRKNFETFASWKMNGKQIKIKDDTTDYIVYFPYPCHQLPPIGQDIPDEGCQCISIDPAIKNFALRIEKRYRTGYIETIQMIKVDFSQYGDVSESTGTTTVDPRILAAATSVLNALLPAMQDSRIVGIERQMAINYKSSRIFQHVLTYFLVMVTTFRYPCIIMDISPKLKGRMLGAPKGLNYTGLKEWSVEKSLEISSWRNDQKAIQIIKQHRGKSKTKADDLADTVNQIEAWFMLMNGIYTKPPQDLNSINYSQAVQAFIQQQQQIGLNPLQTYLNSQMCLPIVSVQNSMVSQVYVPPDQNQVVHLNSLPSVSIRPMPTYTLPAFQLEIIK